MDMPATGDYVYFRTCCRLCGNEDCHMTSIFSSKNRQADLADKIFVVIGIKVTNHDRITMNICERCSLQVTQYHDFKNSSLINQVKLAKQLSVFDAEIMNESIQVKEEDLSDDDEDVVFVPSQNTQLTVKIEPQDSLNHLQDDELPPILSPNLPTAEMLRNLELHTIEHIEELDQVETIETIEDDDSHDGEPTMVISQQHHIESSEQSQQSQEQGEENQETQETQTSHKQFDNFLVPESTVPPSISENSINPTTNHQEPLLNDSRDKIDFAATLNLAKKMDTINMEPFTRTEIQYGVRMRLIYTQLTTRACTCHNEVKATRKSLLSHIKKTDAHVCLPVYTCVNCCSTYPRNGFFKHLHGTCKREEYEYMYDVSNTVERGINKHRNYQAFKCKICLCTARIFEAFVQHVHEHLTQDPNKTCHCGKQFNNVPAFKQHMLSSCVMKPSCDMCDLMFDSAEEFKTHCAAVHDDQEGEMFDVADGYEMLELPFTALYACVECNLKCKQDQFLVAHLQQEHGYDLEAAKRVGADCYIGSTESIQPVQNGDAQGLPSLAMDSDENEQSPTKEIVPKIKIKPLTRGLLSQYQEQKSPAQKNQSMDPDERFMASAYRTLNNGKFECQICFKTFTVVHNCKRHLRNTHLLSNNNKRVGSFTCGNCQSAFPTMAMLQNHLLSEHIHTCKDCGRKCENLDELDKHRSSHLKISLTRDPKTHNYRSSAGDEPGMPVLQHVDAQDRKALTMECTLCKGLFATSRGLAVHIRRSHKEASQRDLTNFPQQCRRKGCHVMLLTAQEWSIHMQMHAKGDSAHAQHTSSGSNSPAHTEDSDYYTCSKCLKVYGNKGNYKQHMKTHGVTVSPKSKRYFCSICKFVCSSNIEWSRHKQSHSNVTAKKAVCKYCKVAFRDEEELMIHMRDEHEVNNLAPQEDLIMPQTWDCEVCGKKMPTKDSLRGHIGWHKRTGTYYVNPRSSAPPLLSLSVNPLEPKVAIMENSNVVNISKQKMFKNKTFVCVCCGTLHPSALALNQHLNSVHSRQRCPTCFQYFAEHADLTEHIRVAHVKSEEGASSHTAKQSLKRLMPTPPAFQPQSKKKRGYEYCKTCGEEFTTEDELRVHMQSSHPGIPFLPKGCVVCPLCQDEFRNMAALSSHMRMHTRRGDVMPGPAPIAALKPNHRTSQVAPMNHVGESMGSVGSNKKFKFHCGICNKGYDLGPDLRKHIMEMHPF